MLLFHESEKLEIVENVSINHRSDVCPKQKTNNFFNVQGKKTMKAFLKFIEKHSSSKIKVEL